MSQEDANATQFFIGTPSLSEVKEYFSRQMRQADIKVLESSPGTESSPELSESFEMYLQMRKERAEEEKKKLMGTILRNESPRSSKRGTFRPSHFNNDTVYVPENTLMQCNDDSFLENEKMCEQTLNLNNVSSNLVDITALDMTSAARKSKSSINETHLNDIEAPSFLFNNTSINSPNRHSPLKACHANRPSTILEVTERSSSTSKTFMSSYQTAWTRSGTESEYKTANEDTLGSSNVIGEDVLIKMPKIRSFYEVIDITKDSLDSESTQVVGEMTKDSLNATSYAEDSSSGVESSFDKREDEADEAIDENFNDTLERFEFMLAQGQKMQAPHTGPPTPMTPRFTPSSQHSPAPSSSSKYLQPKVFTKSAKNSPIAFHKAPGSASKGSPLTKFSPAVKKSPMLVNSAFKKPILSASKIHPVQYPNKKFLHVESPIARYMYETPKTPLTSTARPLPGMESSSKHFNFRDSESFTKENESMNGNYDGSSLPLRAKTKNSAVSHVFEQRDAKKTPCGATLQSMIGKSPTVTVHQGHLNRANVRPKVFKNSMLNDTAISEQSFADLSLFSGDVSVQVVEGVKRYAK